MIPNSAPFLDPTPCTVRRSDHLRCEALRRCVMIIFHERIIVGLIFEFNFTRNPLITQELPSFLLELYKVSLLSIY
jgi:hypothetical protein